MKRKIHLRLPVESTVRRNFLSAYMPDLSFSISFSSAGSGCIPAPSVAYLHIFMLSSGIPQEIIKAPHNHPMRYTKFGHQLANDSLATRRVAQIATFLPANKIFPRNLPSVRNCKVAFSARALAPAAPTANLFSTLHGRNFCSRHGRPQPREFQCDRRAIETMLPSFRFALGCPGLHKCASLFQRIATAIGALRLIASNVSKRSLGNFARKRRYLAAPVAE